jgi:CysZ protein
VTRAIRRFAEGVALPIKGGVFLLRRRRLLLLALAPLLLNLALYVTAVALFVRYYDEWFGLLMDRPEAWYLLVGYYALRILALLVAVAVFIFSFVFVGTVLAAPFLELLSERTEAALRGLRDDQPFRIRQWTVDVLRSVGHAAKTLFILIAAFPLSFLPVVGPAAWLILGWLLLAYDLTSFAMDRRRLSFREKWRLLLTDASGTLGFGAAIFFLMAVPLVGLLVLPAAAVAGTMLFLDLEARPPLSIKVKNEYDSSF